MTKTEWRRNVSDALRIHVSRGNSKIGRAMNVSLPPIVSCERCVECAKRCYARGIYVRRPSVRQAWDENWQAWRADPAEYFRQIDSAIDRYQPAYFRFHVSGDCPDQDYARSVVKLARKHPGTAFLIFTKRYSFSWAGAPENLSVVWSAWPGRPMPTKLRAGVSGVAYVDDGAEPRIPKGALRCPGSCESCGACWDIKATRAAAVVFHLHR